MGRFEDKLAYDMRNKSVDRQLDILQERCSRLERKYDDLAEVTYRMAGILQGTFGIDVTRPRKEKKA